MSPARPDFSGQHPLRQMADIRTCPNHVQHCLLVRVGTSAYQVINTQSDCMAISNMQVNDESRQTRWGPARRAKLIVPSLEGICLET